MASLIAPLIDAPPLQRYGYPEYVKGTAPAAGAHFVQEVGGGKFARLVTVRFTLVTDATVADRQPTLEYRDADDNVVFSMGSSFIQSAGRTQAWNFGADSTMADATVNFNSWLPLLPVLLDPTWDFRIFVNNIQAADQISSVRIVWERFFFTGPPPGLDA